MVEARETAKKILERLYEEFTWDGLKDDQELLEWIEDYLNTDHFEPDDYGNLDVLYKYLEVAVELIREQFGENRPTIYIITDRIDYKDTMYVVFDPEKEAVLDYGWFKWESEPFESVGELLSYIAERYEKMRKKLEKLYGVSLQSLNPDEVAKAGEELYKELKEKYQEVEQA